MGNLTSIFNKINVQKIFVLVLCLLPVFKGVAQPTMGSLEFNKSFFTVNNSDLPSNGIHTLYTYEDALWVGTNGGLARYQQSKRLLVKNFLSPSENTTLDSGSALTFAVQVFDPTYLNSREELKNRWRLSRKSSLNKDSVVFEATLRSPFVSIPFTQEGNYILSVQAVDKYGFHSESKTKAFQVTFPDKTPVSKWEKLLIGITGSGAIYLLALFPLIYFYPTSGLCRSLVNSGYLSKFPPIHNLIMNSKWARSRLFQNYLQKVSTNLEQQLPATYIEKTLIDTSSVSLSRQRTTLEFLKDVTDEHFPQSIKSHMVLGRSGTGKSILLKYLAHLVAAANHQYHLIPLYLDLKATSLKNSVENTIQDALAGGGVELDQDAIQFLIKKGGFLLLFDSVNEVDKNSFLEVFQPFLNRNAYNQVIFATQTNPFSRSELCIYRLAQLTEEQAQDYLSKELKEDIWPKLPTQVKLLATNPQDLSVLKEILEHNQPDAVPYTRADLYKYLLMQDTALNELYLNGDTRLDIIFQLSYVMLKDDQRAVPRDEVGHLISKFQPNLTPELSRSIKEILIRSRMFKEAEKRSTLGLSQRTITFSHELMGKFLASRYLEGLFLAQTEEHQKTILFTAGSIQLYEMLFFTVDTLTDEELNSFLEMLLINCEPDDYVTDATRENTSQIVAYAIKTKAATVSEDTRRRYTDLKLSMDSPQPQSV